MRTASASGMSDGRAAGGAGAGGAGSRAGGGGGGGRGLLVTQPLTRSSAERVTMRMAAIIACGETLGALP